MKRSKLFVIFSCMTLSVYGTGQIPDYLIMGQDTFPIFSNPLEQYFEQKGNRELIDFNGCSSTACWRGYVATWELKNDSLYLRAIASCHENCPSTGNANLKKMFDSEIVFANWFTGLIRIPKGNLVKYIHMGYASIYEGERLITFCDGIMKEDSIIYNHELAQEIRYRQQVLEIKSVIEDTIFSILKGNIDWNYLLNIDFLICDDKYILTFSKHGKLKSVKFAPIGEEIWKDWLHNLFYYKCRKYLKNALRNLDLSYLNLPDSNLKIDFTVFFNYETNELAHLKEYHTY